MYLLNNFKVQVLYLRSVHNLSARRELYLWFIFIPTIKIVRFTFQCFYILFWRFFPLCSRVALLKPTIHRLALQRFAAFDNDDIFSPARFIRQKPTGNLLFWFSFPHWNKWRVYLYAVFDNFVCLVFTFLYDEIFNLEKGVPG